MRHFPLRTAGLLLLCTLAGTRPLAAGSSTYAEVTFFGQQTVDQFQTTPPFILDLSHGDSQGSGRGIADLPDGLLKAQSTASADSTQFTTIATAVDQFTLAGLPAGTPVEVTATLVAHGTGLIPQPFESGTAMVQIQQGVGGIPVDFQIKTFQADISAPENQVFPIDLSASITFQANIGTAFPLLYFLRLDTNHGTDFDFLSTAELRFDLPAGVTVSSEGGFMQAAVPEPSGWVLLGIGAMGLLVCGAWRRSGPCAD
jgi:hypothetical protein